MTLATNTLGTMVQVSTWTSEPLVEQRVSLALADQIHEWRGNVSVWGGCCAGAARERAQAWGQRWGDERRKCHCLGEGCLQSADDPADDELRLDALSIPNYVIKKGRSHGARHSETEEQKENTTWLGMRGRDAVRKSTPKVNILQIFTIDFSEIQFIVNHSSQSDGQDNSAKSGMNLRKKTFHLNSLQRKGEDTKDNGILLWTKQAKMGPWNFDPIFELLSQWKIVSTASQANKLKNPFLQNNTGYGILLQAHRGGTSLHGIWSELIRFFLVTFFVTVGFAYSR